VLPHGGRDRLGAARSVGKGAPAGDQDPAVEATGGGRRE
jgi:hypothetical protein